ncbi:AraC-like DNA-binding protein [Natranaerovirga pectinivora]|uniref:AraC-like DNA-binding protein n=1 Tax=Natranaerovirga pectinivora TaxID=682400 RepID=A0A4R3MRW8_9FIRM|nr:AraC family transcriptional regulator [Natranaerovirga pectinivora]TCT15537.1 AraC-like DNA-binding protein [Natranaerovirga pectinivora]
MNNKTLDFISKLLSDTMKVDMHYFIEPYNDLSTFDRFLRNSLQNSEILYNQVQRFVQTIDHNTFYILKDGYHLNYIFFYPYEYKKDLISIGPYFNTQIDDDYWLEITNENKLSMVQVQKLKGFLYGMPTIDNNLHLISIINNIVHYINPETEPYTVKYHEMSNKKNGDDLYQPKNDFDVYANRVFERYKTEQRLLKYISNGDQKSALAEAEKFVSAPFEPRLKNSLRNLKYLLSTANALFRKSIERNEIHPIYLHEISSKFVNQIENASTSTALNNLYEKMIRDYCLLVRNKSTNQYSPTVRQILHHIEFNLDSKLNLNDLAEKYNLSVPYLSSLFKKEVGITIIKYINQLRIQTAIKLLNTSLLSIQEIASFVGIYDFNYFTKIFKKETGITPSDYRKNLFCDTDDEE